MAYGSYEEWLEEQARKNPAYMQRPADMTFSVDEAENAPDMTIGLDEAQANRPQPFKPDMSFAPQWLETSQPGSHMSFLPEQAENDPDKTLSLAEAERNSPPPSMDLTRDPEALNSPMLQQQMAQRAPQPPAAGMRSQGALASLLPQRDAEMDSRWRTAEQNALSRSGYGGNQSYGVGEAVRDFAPMAIGGALDIFLNKGRGLGALAGAGMQANAQTAANRQKEADAAGRFATSARDQRESVGRAQLGYATEQRQQEQFDMMNNADSPAAKAYAQKLITSGVPPEMVEGLPLRQLQANTAAYTPYFRHAAAELTTQDAAGRQSAVTKARLGAEDEHFPTELTQATQKSGQTAAAGAQARLDVEHGNAPRTLEDEVTRKRRLEEEGLGTGNGLSGHLTAENIITANPGLKFGDPKLLQEALRTRAVTRDVMDQIKAAGRAQGVIDELYQATQAAQEAMKTGDIQGAYAARKQAQSHAEEYAGILGKVSGSNSLEQQRRALDLVPSVLNPMALEGIKALWPSLAVNIKGNLGAYGIEANTPHVVSGETATQPPAAAPQQLGPGQFDVPGNLGVTGGRKVKDTPQLPSDVYRAGNGRQQAAGKAPMSSGSVNSSVPMATPNGDGSFDIDGETYTADEVQKLKTKGLIR
jgi:hypothetical protein